VVPLTDEIRGNAQSLISIIHPSNAFLTYGISKRVRSTFWFGPNNLPYPIIIHKAYPIFPAAPVTVTLIEPSFTV
jgi:hypothetical protein